MEMEAERKTGRKGDDGKMATGKGSSSGSEAGRWRGGGVGGVRRETSKPQDEKAAEPELGKEQGSKSSSSSSLPLGNDMKKADHHIVEDEDFLEILGMSAEEWAEFKAKAVPTPTRKEMMEEWKARMEEEEKADREEFGSDYQAWQATRYRPHWNSIWSGSHGSFEDTTWIPPMRFTYKPALDFSARATPTLQVFSVKVAATTWGLTVTA